MNVQTDFGAAARETDRGVTVDVRVISVLSATQRRRTTSAMLNGYAMRWSYLDAHTALGCEQLHYDDSSAKRHFGRSLAPSEIAVYSSHYAAWKEFLDRGQSDYLLVLEDDLVIDTDFPIQQFAAFCGNLGIGYVRLFGKHYAHALRLGFFFDRSVVRYTTTPAGTQAYLLSVEGARRLCESCRSLNATIDLAMDRFWETDLPLYSIFPYPVIERFAPTQIPIPPSKGEVPRTEKWRHNLQRAISKMQKIHANRRLSRADETMRLAMPSFHQIVGPVEK